MILKRDEKEEAKDDCLGKAISAGTVVRAAGSEELGPTQSSPSLRRSVRRGVAMLDEVLLVMPHFSPVTHPLGASWRRLHFRLNCRPVSETRV